MALLNGEILEPGLKFIQLKSYQLTNANDSNSGQCFAIDQRNQVVFACCRNELIFVPFNSLLNFEAWTKELLKKVEAQVPGKVAVKVGPESLNCHLVSISSRGYGSKLALCAYDQGSLFITFYDLKSLYQNRERAVPYSRFNFSGVNGEVLVRMIHWHPEISDNIFACCLTNGAFDVVYVSDSDRSVITILAHYITPRHVTSFAWSPKGKQIVVAFRDTTQSYFSQFKLPIDEKNLVQNIPFDEVKKINLIDDLRGFHVINICWLSTFNFVVICYSPAENSTRYLLVSMPSAKATGNDAIMKIVDYGCLNIDSTDANVIEVNLQQLDNIIFTYTNRSSNIALLACPSSTDIGTYNKWCEVSLEDDASLVLPTFGTDDFAIVRGLAFAHGTAKQFRFTSSEVKGGPERPFVLTYNANGHLTLFLCDYESGSNSAGFLRVPSPPTTLLKPIVSSSVQNQASTHTPAPSFAQQNAGGVSLFGSLSSTPNKAAANNAALNFNTPPSANTQSQTANQASGGSLASLLASTESPKATPPPQQQRQQFPQPVYEPISPVEEAPRPQVQQQSQAKEPENLDALCAEECRLNMEQFSQELDSLMKSIKSTLTSSNIGSSEQFDKLKCEFQFIEGMLETLNSQYNAFNVDINELQANYLDLHYLCEETRSLCDRNTDPKYRSILRQRTLDPITLRKVKEIQAMRDYISLQLRELENKFDQEWAEWLQRKRMSSADGGGGLGGSTFLSSAARARQILSPPTSPHMNFIERRKTGKENGGRESTDNKSSEEAYVSNVLVRMLNNNQQVIDSLKGQIREMAKTNPQLAAKANGLISEDHHGSNTGVHALSAMFNQSMSLNKKSGKMMSASSKTTTTVTCMEPGQRAQLKNFLVNRPSVPVRVCGSGSSESDDALNRSRFISVLEKIKEKDRLKEKSKPVQIPSSTSKSVPSTLASAAATSTAKPFSVSTTPAAASAITTSSFSSKTSNNISATFTLPAPVAKSVTTTTATSSAASTTSATTTSATNLPASFSLNKTAAAVFPSTGSGKPSSSLFGPPPPASIAASTASKPSLFGGTGNTLLAPVAKSVTTTTATSSAASTASAATTSATNLLASFTLPAPVAKSVPSTLASAAATSTAKPFSVSTTPAAASVVTTSSSSLKTSNNISATFTLPAPISKSVTTTTATSSAASTTSAATSSATNLLASFSFNKAAAAVFPSTGSGKPSPSLFGPPPPASIAASTASKPSLFGGTGNTFAGATICSPSLFGSSSPALSSGAGVSSVAPTTTTSATSAPVTTSAATAAAVVSPSNLTSSFSFGKALAATISGEATKGAASTSPFSSFSFPTSNSSNASNTFTSAKPADAVTTAADSTASATNLLSSFSFNKTAAAVSPISNSGNTGSIFGSVTPSQSPFNLSNNAGGSIFGTPAKPAPSGGGFFGNVASPQPAPPAFGAASTANLGASPGAFGGSPVFGQSPVFGGNIQQQQATFGGSPTFGGAATFGAPSPGSSPFSSPIAVASPAAAASPFGVGGGAPTAFSGFGASAGATSGGFGTFAVKEADAGLSFGSFATGGSESAMGSMGGMMNGGGGGPFMSQQQPQMAQQQQFGNSPSFSNTPSFTQRRM